MGNLKSSKQREQPQSAIVYVFLLPHTTHNFTSGESLSPPESELDEDKLLFWLNS